MKIVIDDSLKGKELFKFLRENKQALLDQKKSLLKECDAVQHTPVIYNLKGDKAEKANIGDIPADATSIHVKVVANTSMWMDSDFDVLLRDSAKKSFKERKGLILHLKNHGRTLDDQIADVTDIYYEDISLKELGFNKPGTAQALIFESDVKREYDPKTFDKYRKGLIKQHSIGLQYVKIDMAINDPEDEKEYDFWNKYIDQIINKEVAEERGFFFVVPEYKLIENSAVLFGSNRLTPTLEVYTEEEPQKSTLEQPLSTWDLDTAIKQIKFFN